MSLTTRLFWTDCCLCGSNWPQIEQSIKLCRFLACTAAGTAATAAGSAAAAPVVEALKTQLKSEVDAAVGFILDNLASLSLMEDKAVALAEASQVRQWCCACRYGALSAHALKPGQTPLFSGELVGKANPDCCHYVSVGFKCEFV